MYHTASDFVRERLATPTPQVPSEAEDCVNDYIISDDIEMGENMTYRASHEPVQGGGRNREEPIYDYIPDAIHDIVASGGPHSLTQAEVNQDQNEGVYACKPDTTTDIKG